MMWSARRIGIASLCAIIAVGLSIANEKRRSVVIAQNKAIAQKAECDLKELRYLGFADCDAAMQSTQERLHAAQAGLNQAQNKWWMISVKAEEKKNKQCKLKRLVSLNRKILKSYRQDLNDMRKFGFPDNDPRVVFSRNKVAETVVELAHLTREYNHALNKQESINSDQKKLVERMLQLNQQSIADYKAEIAGYFESGLGPDTKKVRDVRSKIAVKLAENSLLERKLHQ